jgi:hypothetical protein
MATHEFNARQALELLLQKVLLATLNSRVPSSPLSFDGCNGVRLKCGWGRRWG